jgi:hypothetical protein
MLDHCLKLSRVQAVKFSGGFEARLIEEGRVQLAELRSETSAPLFVLAKANELIHFRIGEYVPLTASADMMGHCGLSLLLETCLAGDIGFIDLTKRMIGNIVEANRAPPQAPQI